MAGVSKGKSAGLPVVSSRTSTVTVGGASDSMYAFSSSKILCGSWLPTSRQLSLHPALAGTMVLGPGPDQPLHRPLTSSVGRAEMRSRML